MTALAAPGSTQRFGFTTTEPNLNFPIKAATKCYMGGIAVLDAGYIAPGRTALGLVAVGVFSSPGPAGIDNTGGAAGAITAAVVRGTFKLKNSAAADAIAQANVGGPCFIVDDATVALTDGGGTRSYAGAVMQIDTDGVWVEIGAVLGRGAGAGVQYPVGSLILPVTLASLVVGGGTIIGPIALGYAGRIASLAYIAAVTGTGAGATFACNLKIGSTALTGGVCTITLANTGYGATPVLGTAVTALNTFLATDTLTLVNAAGTVFTAGSGFFIVGLA